MTSTGGSRGIGAAITEALAGASVTFTHTGSEQHQQAVEEASLLTAVNRIVGDVEIQNDFFWRRVTGGDEGIDQNGRP